MYQPALLRFTARAALLTGLLLPAALPAAAGVLDEVPLPDIGAVTDYRPKIPLRVYSADKVLIGEFGAERRDFVRLGECFVDIKVNTRSLDGKAQAVEIQGEIDVYTSPRVKETINELIEKENYQLLINLEKVRYIDSTGLVVLIGALKKVREHSGRILLVCTNPQIKKIFNITGLVKIFEIFASEEEALAVLTPAS